MSDPDDKKSNQKTLSLQLSADGFVRLQFSTLATITWEHLIAGVDSERKIPVQEGASASEVIGYTEWISKTDTVLTIGWDWKLDLPHSKPVRYLRSGIVRSNIKLINESQRDLSPSQTEALLETFVDSLNWEESMMAYISGRYK